MNRTARYLDLEIRVRNRLEAYLRGECSLRSFWRWFAPAVWTMDDRASKRPPDSLKDLVYGIEALIYEHDDGCWTEQQFRSQLESLL